MLQEQPQELGTRERARLDLLRLAVLIAEGDLAVLAGEAEEGGYWAEVPSIPGCATQGKSFDELLSNIYEAVEGCLSVDVQEISVSEKDKIMEIAI